MPRMPDFCSRAYFTEFTGWPQCAFKNPTSTKIVFCRPVSEFWRMALACCSSRRPQPVRARARQSRGSWQERRCILWKYPKGPTLGIEYFAYLRGLGSAQNNLNPDPSTRVSRAGANAREPSLAQDDSVKVGATTGGGRSR